jgi:putative ubiquitin-RnfH superfamily antitoxin RatB of RatAB toxin-antitoxin module
VNRPVRVEVAFALPLEQDVTSVECPPGTTVREAIGLAGVLARHTQIDLSRTGIWGRRCGLDDAVRDGDRIELYRPVTADPKEARRRRAADRQR